MTGRARALPPAALVVAMVGGTLLAVVATQEPAAPRQAAQPSTRSPSTYRIAVDLVQLDAVVTDRRGQPVHDLRADEFEVLQDGRPQPIASFGYVAAGGQPAAPDVTRSAAGSPGPIAPGHVRRTIAIVVDDLGLSFESTARVRDVLRQFVDRDVRPGDLVAILRTGAGMGALQQFTTDRRVLHAAVERVRWNFMARVSPFGPRMNAEDALEAFRTEVFTAGTLGAVQYVVKGVSELPGRKSVVLLSDGFRLLDADGKYGRTMDALRALVDAANRAGVVIYTIDARGLVTGGIRPDQGSSAAPEELQVEREELLLTQEGLGAVAAQTGGLFIRNNNDIGAMIRRALDDQRGYYLLGYVPERSTFAQARPRFHEIRVRVKRPGLRVRSRRGFLGRPDEARTATPADRMAAAVTSPFAGGDIRLRLTSFFGEVPKVGPVVQSFMHVDARELTFTEQADGVRSSQIETLAVTFGENGQVADEKSQRYTVALTPENYAKALKAGFVYTLRVPVKRPGPYQLRIALRDVHSDRIGSASHFIDVPDVKKGRLTLSGLLIQGTTPDVNGRGGADDPVDSRDPNATVAVRTFRQGTEATYACYVYNARRDRSGQPHLESEIRLYREGVDVFQRALGRIAPLPGVSGDVAAAGVLQVGRSMPPGSYVMEIVVTDRLARKPARATQTIDFEVVE